MPRAPPDPALKSGFALAARHTDGVGVVLVGGIVYRMVNAMMVKRTDTSRPVSVAACRALSRVRCAEVYVSMTARNAA